MRPACGRIEALCLDVRKSWPKVAGEGRSLYFHDYDNHLFELHAGTLDERLARCRQGRDAAPAGASDSPDTA